jgi:putative transposase
MKYEPLMPIRKSLRLGPESYKQKRSYFVTVCTQGRKCVLGTVENGGARLSQIGIIVRDTWIELPERFVGLVLSEFVTMPNHFHGIVTFTGALGSKGPTNTFSLPEVLRVFKSISTVHTNRVLQTSGTPLWQRGFHDHVIRDGEDMRLHQRYILENPQKWEWDEDNPERTSAKRTQSYKSPTRIL